LIWDNYAKTGWRAAKWLRWPHYRELIILTNSPWSFSA